MKPISKLFTMTSLILMASCNDGQEESNQKYETALREKDAVITSLKSAQTPPIVKIINDAEEAVGNDSSKMVTAPHTDPNTGETYWITVQKTNPAEVKAKQMSDALQNTIDALSRHSSRNKSAVKLFQNLQQEFSAEDKENIKKIADPIIKRLPH